MPRRPLKCYECGSAEVIVSESQQFLLSNKGRRLHADVRCARCGHQWWSIHHDALYASRLKDRAAKDVAQPKA